MVLEAQKEIQETQGETIQLISHQELIAIQVIWYRDVILREKVADIYNSILTFALKLMSIRKGNTKKNSFLERFLMMK